MIYESHELIKELPEHKETITTLKNNNNHFARLYDDYDELNKEILRIEKEITPTSDEYLEELKKKRLMIKDEILEMIRQQEEAA